MKKEQAQEINDRLLADGQTVTDEEMRKLGKYNRRELRSFATQTQRMASLLAIGRKNYGIGDLPNEAFGELDQFIEIAQFCARFWPELEPWWSDIERSLMSSRDILRGKDLLV